MSEVLVGAETCVALGAAQPQFEAHPSREVTIGSLTVQRALPVKGRRLVGPWCFLDRVGPLTFSEGRAIDVAPHPHMGLQTVTWLLEGEILHDDSLGNESVLSAGGVLPDGLPVERLTVRSNGCLSARTRAGYAVVAANQPLDAPVLARNPATRSGCGSASRACSM